MNKKHVYPVFQVIEQNEANAKFFVASGTVFCNNDCQGDTECIQQGCGGADTGGGFIEDECIGGDDTSNISL